MRFRRLDLTRYGHFSDFSLDFGASKNGEPDFHIIYGPNESGKSTLFSAVLDLMFGIKTQSPYGFLHDYKSMRIGAALQLGKGADIQNVEIARIKRDKASLLGPGDEAIPDTILTSAYGAIDRDAYMSMFSLDDDTLQSGGEAILQSKGDLGRLLFSATSGLSEVSLQLDSIKQNADGFYAKGRRATELKRLKDELADLKTKRAEIDTSAVQYKNLADTAAEAAANYQRAEVKRKELKLAHEKVRRLLDASPIWADLQSLQAQIEPLEKLADAPAGWAREVQELERRQAVCLTQIETAEAEQNKITAEISAITVDDAILEQSERMEGLGEQEGRYLTASDIPARQAECDGVDQEVDLLHQRLGRPTPKTLRASLLPAATIGALRDLIQSCPQIKREQEAAAEELKSANERREEIELQLGNEPELFDVTEMAALVGQLRSAQTSAILAQATKRLNELEAEKQEALAMLAPWQGSYAELANQSPPSQNHIDALKTEQGEIRVELEGQKSRQNELSQTRDQLAAEVNSVEQNIASIDQAQISTSRAERDEAWQTHLVQINQSSNFKDGKNPPGKAAFAEIKTTAQNFADHLASDDALRELAKAQSLAHSADIARLRLAGENIAKTEVALTYSGKKIEQLTMRQDAIAQDIADFLQGLALAETTSLSDLQKWLERREAALKLMRHTNRAQEDVDAAEEQIERDQEALAEAMSALAQSLSTAASFEVQLEMAQSAIDQQRQAKSKIAELQNVSRAIEIEFEARSNALQNADIAANDWQDAWNAALASCWLGEIEPAPSPAQMGEILDLLAQLPALIDKREDLLRRIKAMEADKQKFIAEMEQFSAALGDPFKSAEARDYFQTLRRRLEDAKSAAKLRASKNADLQNINAAHAKAGNDKAEIDRRRAEMTKHYGVETFTELALKLEQAQKKGELHEQVLGRQCDLVIALDVGSLTQAETQMCALFAQSEDGNPDDSGQYLNDAGLEAKKAELIDLAAQIEAGDAHVRDLFHQNMTAAKALEDVGGDDRAARLEEDRQTVLLDVTEKAQKYLELKVGVAAAERALQIYTERHRSTMMTRASDAFRTITDDGFSGLTTSPSKSGETLIGLQSTGRSLEAGKMSKGTCFQLFLALRIAGYHEFVQTHEALPFLADDIMETFDDQRSAAAFRLLEGLSTNGQVIYLTHHPHLCEIAKESCGDRVQIHQLPNRRDVASHP